MSAGTQVQPAARTQTLQDFIRASKVQQRTLGHDHPHTVASLSNLATVYDAMGEPERAKAMQVTRTQIWKKRTSSAS